MMKSKLIYNSFYTIICTFKSSKIIVTAKLLWLKDFNLYK